MVILPSCPTGSSTSGEIVANLFFWPLSWVSKLRSCCVRYERQRRRISYSLNTWDSITTHFTDLNRPWSAVVFPPPAERSEKGASRWTRLREWLTYQMDGMICGTSASIRRAFSSSRGASVKKREKQTTGNRQKPGYHVLHVWASFPSGCHHLSDYLDFSLYRIQITRGSDGTGGGRRIRTSGNTNPSAGAAVTGLSSSSFQKKISPDVFTRLSFI